MYDNLASFYFRIPAIIDVFFRHLVSQHLYSSTDNFCTQTLFSSSHISFYSGTLARTYNNEKKNYKLVSCTWNTSYTYLRDHELSIDPRPIIPKYVHVTCYRTTTTIVIYEHLTNDKPLPSISVANRGMELFYIVFLLCLRRGLAGNACQCST